ncbi:hypothetical protein ECZU51_05060 [Escherichia coli]|nr:hypothetical protein ECZU51_05060 [Escherichia coli]
MGIFGKKSILYADNIYIIDIIVIHHVATKAVVIKGGVDIKIYCTWTAPQNLETQLINVQFLWQSQNILSKPDWL